MACLCLLQWFSLPCLIASVYGANMGESRHTATIPRNFCTLSTPKSKTCQNRVKVTLICGRFFQFRSDLGGLFFHRPENPNRKTMGTTKLLYFQKYGRYLLILQGKVLNLSPFETYINCVLFEKQKTTKSALKTMEWGVLIFPPDF